MYIKEYHSYKNINPIKRRPNRKLTHNKIELELIEIEKEINDAMIEKKSNK
jgi:hypothetical protein